MATAPERRYTFLFTDIEGSTRRWSRDPVAMARAVQRQDELLGGIVAARGGQVFKTVGDGVYAVFTDPVAAVRAAVDAQRALLAEAWSELEPKDGIAVRIALHTGPAEERDDDYFGPPLNRLSRTLDAGHGGQILCTDDTLAACGENWPEEIALRDLGERTLRDVPGKGRIFQLVVDGLPEHFPPLDTLDPRVHNLPHWPAPSIGREEDAARLRSTLRSRDAHLVTVLGTGGVGKTRLTTEVAVQLLDEFQDGIRFVDLSALREDAQVLPAIVQVTGAADQLLDPRDALLDWLHDRKVLLVLDNCEQVMDGVAAIASDILNTAPGVVMLATSRTPIRIRGERQIALDPLPLPTDADKPGTNPGVRLFAERAREVSEHFVLDSDSIPAVREICRIVDGLPLAIELAAAWVRILSPAALQRRLQESRAMLRDGARDLPDRQRTLASTIAWSYDLLDPDDQRAFRRLAVFRGGIAVDAAAAVIWNDPVDDPLWALTRLDSLVQAHLLQVTPDPTGEPRFVMLQTIQEFAIDILRESGEWQEAATAHAEFFAKLAAEASEHYGTEDVSHWLERLDLDFENLRAAIEFDASTPETKESGLRLLVSLAGYLDQRAYRHQARTWFDLTYQDDARFPPELRVDALFQIGNTWHSDPMTAGEFYRRSIQVAEAAQEDELRIRSVASLSTVSALSGDYETALSMAHEVIGFGLQESNPKYIAQGYYRLAYITCEAGIYDQALSACQQARSYARKIGDAHREAWTWVIEGRALGQLHRPDAAVDALDHAVAYFAETGDEEELALCHLELALAAMDTDPVSARRHLNIATIVFAETIDAYTIITTLECAARLLACERRFLMAAELIGAAQRLREQSGIVATKYDGQAIQSAIDLAKSEVGVTAFDLSFERGRLYSPRAAMDHYLSISR